MKRIVLIIEYDGTNYVGWQVQPNGIAVQQVICEALHRLTGERLVLHASGRTDSGVHARAQVAHFDTECRIPPDKYAFALNTYLPADIRIKASFEMPGEWAAGANEFHSRFSVKRKHYRYRVLNSVHNSAFLRDTALHIHASLDIEKLNAAAALFLGEHDFAAFKASGSKAASTVRSIYASQWSQEGELLVYDVAGSGFLYNMVRIMVGTMLRIGMGYAELDTIKCALENPSRENAGDTAPAHGLTLWRVEYDEFDTERILRGSTPSPAGALPQTP
ncbi:MAG: tRNA pseudouridine(38-40) synthase TruA [Christensenellaceae bacterium]|nr:tRNA pseudouridine(38-40) synthase TruA [Christensenellaceae bacterium]